MKKRKLLLPFSFLLLAGVGFYYLNSDNNTTSNISNDIAKSYKKEKKTKKTTEERRLFSEERAKYELNLQKNPTTGEVPRLDKILELNEAKTMMAVSKSASNVNASNNTYISRGPSNLGGRTRAIVIDKSDPTGNTILAGGVSGGVFRTTNGGDDWSKVSPNDEVFNVTAIAQDPRAGSENIWYYGTGELSGNSTSGGGAFYLGQGIWKSEDNGLTWTVVPGTTSTLNSFDSEFDIVHRLAVHPVTGDLYAATVNGIRKYDGNTWSVEIDTNATSHSDIVITSTGIAYASLANNTGPAVDGVWKLENGGAAWSRIGSNATTGFGSIGRNVIAVAPSNENILYSFIHTANDPNNSTQVVQTGLWQWNDATDTWVDYSSKMPDEPGGNLRGNDPISIQGGYDMEVSVKPDNENFVVIGGTNVYRIANITINPSFTRIGGYINNQSYGLYDLGGGDTHHSDIHSLVFDPNNPDRMYSGTDGGVHRTNDINDITISWTNLNNNYQTYQFYHVDIDPQNGSDIILGGAQDNGTVIGGTDAGLANNTEMNGVFGGDGVAVAISRDVTSVPRFMGVQNGPIFRITNNFAEITPTGSASQFVTYFYLDPDNNNALYYAGQSTLFSTDDSSNVTEGSWTNAGNFSSNSGIPNQNISQVTTSRGAYTSSSYLLVGGNLGSLLRVNDPQNSTLNSAVNITPAGISPNSNVSGISVHPTNPDIAMVTYSNYGVPSIFITNNATNASPVWTQVERNLETFSIRSAMITEVDGETRYFVGTARGLYSTTSPTTTDWAIEAPDQIGFAVVSALRYRTSDDKLLVGTHGNGVFEGTIQRLSVDEFNASSDNAIVMYPNPASSTINVSLEASFVEGDLNYAIVDITGKIVKNGQLSSNKQIDINSLNNGVYFLQLRSNAKTKTSKFIKI